MDAATSETFPRGLTLGFKGKGFGFVILGGKGFRFWGHLSSTVENQGSKCYRGYIGLYRGLYRRYRGWTLHPWSYLTLALRPP